MGYIYKITNNQNNKIYIGKTQRTINIRWKEHKKDCFNKEKDNKLYRAMRKYGVENFTIEQLEIVPDYKLSDKEKLYIQKYNSYYSGYNSTFGGDGESKVDFSMIEKLYKNDLSCLQISKITGHTPKTISNLLKGHGYKVKHASTYKSTGKKVIFEHNVYHSYSELARYLINNIDYYHNKNLNATINYISKHTANGVFYLSKNNEIIGKEIKFNNKIFPSYTELAIHLIKNDIKFHDKKLNTVIQGISSSIKNKKPYLSYCFY